MSKIQNPKLTADDFKTDQDVRWCPGCGDYAILAAVQRLLPDLGVPRENFVFVSGIGCAARFPYYMETYGIHSIHGRAPTLATGIKATNPDLSVWIITGDGDSLSIGGNHLLHAMRRNVDLNILMFNNEIYGLTKGQTSPTSPLGRITKTTPMGSGARPVNPLSFALGAGCSFVARSVDRQIPHLTEMMRRAQEHEGTAFIEILQNCNIFNDGAFDHWTNRKLRADRQLALDDGEPLVFGKDVKKGVCQNGFGIEVVELEDEDETSGLLVHDEGADASYAFALAEAADDPNFPLPIGVLRKVDRPSYEKVLHAQMDQARSDEEPDLQKLLDGDDTWTVA